MADGKNTGKVIISGGVGAFVTWLLLHRKSISLSFMAIMHQGESIDWIANLYILPGIIRLNDNIVTDVIPKMVQGETVTIEAIPSNGYPFIFWYINGEVVSDNPYTFCPAISTSIVAVFGYGGPAF
jgi:uncharacterized membrane protein